jgi:alpha,alpha-trehalase
MFPSTKFFRIAGSWLCQGVLLLSNVAFSFSAGASARLTTGVAGARAAQTTPQALRPAPPAEALNDIRQYISMAWNELTRSVTQCESLTDAKTSEPPVLYLPAELSGEATPAAVTELQKRCAVQIERLPARITKPGEIDPASIHAPGLLYLENPYVVPGGQFNEMYGWDSYFIIRGLLANQTDNQQDGDALRADPAESAKLALAKGMVENFFFEIEHYGGVLNANRTYYLTRSQPPFLSSMILAVFQAEKRAEKSDREWLSKAYGYAERDYQQWTTPPHLAGDTGLARYFDRGEGPVPEIMGDPSHYYRGVAQYFLMHGGAGSRYLVHVDAAHPAASSGPLFPVQVCEEPATAPPTAPDKATSGPVVPRPQTAPVAQECAPAENVALTAEFYKGDRSLRESGFDITFRFGPYGADTHHYAPVCLNSLLYKTEEDLAAMSTILGRPQEALRWKARASERQQRIVKYLWDARRGMFFDYDFTTGKRSSYEYATTFYPLWAGLASKEQAQAVTRNLALFEQAGGVAMSRRETQAQWDYPYGWAPIHLLAVEGLRRYGYTADADRISQKFLGTVLRNFEMDRTIREKYDVVARSQITHVGAGYAQNVIGFGWTNGVFLELLREIPQAARARLN